MEQFFNTALDYLLNVVVSTASQLLILFGPLLLLAFLMSLISKVNQDQSCKLFGNKVYLYIFGWLGTSVHELGHAFFALIFGHKITEIKLFTPNPDGGSLGHVTHSYDRKNIYQNIGNFFIGIGPVLLGSVVLFLIAYFLFGFNVLADTTNLELTPGKWVSFASLEKVGIESWNKMVAFAHRILSDGNSVWWKTAILVYVLYSVGSSITLSPADVKGTARGFLFTVCLLFVFNLATLWIGDFSVRFFIQVSSFFTGLYFLMLFTMVINTTFILAIIFMRLVAAIFSKNK
jgi:hypothetical protein